MTGLRLYSELATWWPLMSPPADYAEEAAFYEQTLVAASARPPRTALELGSGGGNNASFMKSHLELVLVDLSPAMLEVSRALNPECEHAQGDMRTVRLDREFDCVFVQDAVCYMATEPDLRAAIETAFIHCRPGGVALFAPDHVRETFRPGTEHGGEDDGSRGMRFLEWSFDPDPTDTSVVSDYVYAMRESDGSLHVEHERHIEGLFGREVWLRLLREAGFEPKIVPFDHSDLEAGSYELFVATRPEGDT